MSRRRPTLTAYVRRRWRYVGAIVVLLLGALLVLAMTDRGHDPVWEVADGEIASAAVAPDGAAVYTLVREEGNITKIRAQRGDDGALLWVGQLEAVRAVLAAGPAGAAVATDFPGAFLTIYGADGSVRVQTALEGNPDAIVFDGDHLALALNAATRSNPVLVYEGEHLVRTLPHPSRVQTLDMAAGIVAAAGIQGDLVVHHVDGREIANVSLGFSPKSLRLADDGTAVIVGGTGLTPADPRGKVAFIDLLGTPTMRWQQDTPAYVGLVDLDAAALRALAIEETPPTATIHVYDGATGGTLWTRATGSIPRDDAGVRGAASLSPDAERVAVATASGHLRLYDAATGDERWSYRAAGATHVLFPDEDAQRIVTVGRLLPSRPHDTLMAFSVQDEPLAQRAVVLASGITALGVLALFSYIGIGYWRLRRAY